MEYEKIRRQPYPKPVFRRFLFLDKTDMLALLFA